MGWVYSVVKLKDKRHAVFIGASYHVGCCQEAEVLFEDGHVEIVNPDDYRHLETPTTLDESWYDFYGKKKPIKAWERFADLKTAYERYRELSYEEMRIMRTAAGGGPKTLMEPGYKFSYSHPKVRR